MPLLTEPGGARQAPLTTDMALLTELFWREGASDNGGGASLDQPFGDGVTGEAGHVVNV